MNRSSSDAIASDGGEAGDGCSASAQNSEGSDANRSTREQSTEESEPRATNGNGAPGREVVVPLSIYKIVTVFSTLIAIVAILAGFVLLDRATRRATAAPEEVNAVLAVLALGLIGVGAAVYAFSTRFRAEGMGKPKDDTDEPTDNG